MVFWFSVLELCLLISEAFIGSGFVGFQFLMLDVFLGFHLILLNMCLFLLCILHSLFKILQHHYLFTQGHHGTYYHVWQVYIYICICGQLANFSHVHCPQHDSPWATLCGRMIQMDGQLSIGQVDSQYNMYNQWQFMIINSKQRETQLTNICRLEWENT